MKTFFELREATKSADKKPENYVGPDGKAKVRMVPTDKNVAESGELADGYRVHAISKDGEKMKSGVHSTAKAAHDMHYKMAKSGMYKKIDVVKETTDLDELSSKTLTSYMTKASSQAGKTNTPANTQDKRIAGVNKAMKKANEEVELDEGKKGVVLGFKDQYKSRAGATDDGQRQMKKLGGSSFTVYQSSNGLWAYKIFEGVEDLDEAGPKIKPDFLKVQRAKDAAHNDAMGRTATGRKKPVRTMTSTQRSMASMNKEEVELDELTAAEKKMINQMYDKKGNLTAIGKKVMDQGKAASKLTPKDIDADNARRKEYNAYQKSKRNEEVELDEVTVANSTAAFDLKKKAESYKKTMIAAQQAKGQAAHDKFLKARTAFMNALKKLKQMDLPKAELDALKKGTNISESVELDEGLSNLSHSRLKYHATKGIPHGSHSNAEIKDEHKRRLRSEPDYVKAKASMNEDIKPKPDATEVIQKKKQMAAISSPDKDKLSKIAQMMARANEGLGRDVRDVRRDAESRTRDHALAAKMTDFYLNRARVQKLNKEKKPVKGEKD